jgi:hypothetical protein
MGCHLFCPEAGANRFLQIPIYRTTHHYISEDQNLNIHCYENAKYQTSTMTIITTMGESIITI